MDVVTLPPVVCFENIALFIIIILLSRIAISISYAQGNSQSHLNGVILLIQVQRLDKLMQCLSLNTIQLHHSSVDIAIIALY
jgi:hypothetical protein